MDIYDLLKSNGCLKSEKGLKLKKKEKRRKKLVEKMRKTSEESITSSDDEEMTEREERESRVESLITPINNINHIFYLKTRYEDELKEYEYVDGNNIDKLKCGGYIRCVNLNDELKWGGVLVKLIDNKKIESTKLLLKNKSNKLWSIYFYRYYVFYKKNKTRNDKFRELFIAQYMN